MKQGLPAHYSKSDHFQIALMMSLLTLTNGSVGGDTFILAKPTSQNFINNNKCSHWNIGYGNKTIKFEVTTKFPSLPNW